MPATFREYQDEDQQLLLALSKKLDEHAKTSDPIRRIKNLPGFSEVSLKETLEKVSKFQGKIWLAQDKDEVVGYIIGVIWKQSEKNQLEIGPHKLGEVTDIYLEEDHRSQGIGTTMLQMMENYFKEKGCDSIWISVFAPNLIAHKMYKKHGFSDRTIGMLKEL